MSCSYIVNRDEIRVKSDYLRGLFTNNNLRNIRVTANKNCCTGSEIKKSFEFCAPGAGCNYRIRYCTDNPTFLYKKGIGSQVLTINVSHFCDLGLIVTGVLSNSGGALPDYKVTLWVDGVEQEAFTDNNGNYNFTFGPITNGTYNVEVRTDDGAIIRKSYTITDCQGSEYHIPLTYPNQCNDISFIYLNEIVIAINGINKNIVKVIYNLTSEAQREKLVEDVNKWFAANCVGASMTLDYEYDEGNICYDFQILGLPNNMEAKYINIYGSGDCGALPEFTCTETEEVDLCVDAEGVRCGEFKIEILLTQTVYKALFLRVKRPECAIDTIPFNDGVVGYTLIDNSQGNTPDLSVIVQAIQDFYDTHEITGTVTASVVNNLLTISFTTPMVGFTPLTFYYEDSEAMQTKQQEVVCTSYDYHVDNCEWVARIETKTECGDMQFGYITRTIDGTGVPELVAQMSISAVEYDGEDSGIAIVNKIKEFFPGAFVSFTRMDGYKPDSIMEIKIAHSDWKPRALITFDQNGQIYQTLFSCTNLYSICDTSSSEDTDEVGFTEEEMIFYPEFFGGNEFVDGVYNIEICYVLLDDTVIQETFCVFKGDDIMCLLPGVVEMDPATTATSLFDALKLSEECTDCECEKMCNIYEELVNEVNRVYKTNKLEGCNC